MLALRKHLAFGIDAVLVWLLFFLVSWFALCFVEAWERWRQSYRSRLFAELFCLIMGKLRQINAELKINIECNLQVVIRECLAKLDSEAGQKRGRVPLPRESKKQGSTGTRSARRKLWRNRTHEGNEFLRLLEVWQALAIRRAVELGAER